MLGVTLYLLGEIAQRNATRTTMVLNYQKQNFPWDP